jgi:tRNA threonylcarbamoyladenosine biosynthesis protein TsaB
VIILAVHSTTPVLGVAFIEDRRLLGEVVLLPGRQHVENLTLSIKDLTARLSLDLTMARGFGVAIGPGSFSGTRIGLATIKGIALALEKPVIGVSCLDILAWQGLDEGQTGVSVIDAKRGQVYAALNKRTDGRLVLLAGPMLLHANELAELMDRWNCQVLVSADSVAAGLSGPKMRIRSATPSAMVCGLLAAERLGRGEVDEIHSLYPLYIRRSDAEEQMRCTPLSRPK